MYVFNVVDVENTDKVVAGPFDSGAEAGAKASELNEQYRDAGEDRRVRVLKEEREPEKMIPALWRKGSRGVGPNPEPYLLEDDIRYDLEHFRNDDNHRVYTVPKNGVSWRECEHRRSPRAAPFTDETWYRDSEYAALHYPHADPDNPEHVRFVPSEQAGQQGPRYKSMSPGRYLQTYFGDQLSDEQVQEHALDHATEHRVPELQVTQDADEIERVYVDGPRSCMSRQAHRYDSAPIHPTRVYAGPDLALAWVEDDKGKIRARAVVWPEKKRVSRIYGDEERMMAALEEAGYDTLQDNMNGARIQKIEAPDEPGAYVMPYIDGALNVRGEGRYFVVDGAGDLPADSEQGVLYQNHCAHCGRGANSRNMRDVDGQMWCEGCVIDYTAECGECWNLFPMCQTREVDLPDCYRILCETCYDDTVAVCDGCGDEYPAADVDEAPDADAYTGTPPTLCPDCYEKEMEDYRGKARRTGPPLHVVIPDTPAQAEQRHLPFAGGGPLDDEGTTLGDKLAEMVRNKPYYRFTLAC